MDRSTSSTNGVGVLAVCAVSLGIVFLSSQLHKRLLANLKKTDIELHGEGEEINDDHKSDYKAKKKVRFADDVVEPSSDSKEYRRRRSRGNHDEEGGQTSSGAPLKPKDR